MATELLAHLEELLKGSPSRLVGVLDRGARGIEWIATEVVVGHPEALERVPGRHLVRSVLGRDLVLVKGGVGGVNDDGISGRHDGCYCLLYFIIETPYLCLFMSI